MSRRDDDLSPFRDDPVFQALTGPATAAELAGEAQAVATFRNMTSSRPRRRFAARIGTGGTVAIATLALSGGVAAAYTASLPTPLQRIVHEAGGALGVPPAHKDRPAHHSSPGSHPKPPVVAAPAPGVVTTTPAAGAEGTPSPRATTTVPPGAVTPSPVVTPTSPVIVTTSTPSPTPTPSRTPLLKGATLALTASASRVTAGTSITVTGQLDASDSTPIAGRRVALRERQAGAPGWTRIAVETTSSAGAVSFTVPPLERNVRFVLHTGRQVHSDIMRVVVTPVISETVEQSTATAGLAAITATVQGGEPGDTVVLSWADGKKRRHAVLDAAGAATFTVHLPPDRPMAYRLFLRRTPAHAAASLSFTASLP